MTKFLPSICSINGSSFIVVTRNVLQSGKIAEYFNVTTDYLLGVSEVKRDLQGQMKVNKTLDTYYDLIEIYKGLDEYDQEMVWSIMQTVKKAGEKRKRDRENTEES